MLNTAYCTVDEANEINNSDAWNVLVEAEKQTALDWGRVYLDKNYYCAGIAFFSLTDSETDAAIENAIKAANAVLGDEYANGNLFEATPTTNRVVAEKMVKAGSVSSKTRYAEPTTGEVYDPFPQVSALLGGICTLTTTNFAIHPVIRG